MKKYNLIKVLGITVLVTWLLTFIIPASTISEGINRGSATPFGIWNLLLNSLVSVTYFNTLGIYIVVIAVFYGVLELVKQYNDLCDKIAKGLKDKRRVALIISILFFSLLSLVVSDPLSLLVFVPFFWKILSKLEIDKKHIVLATIISMLVGSIGLICNSTVANNFSSSTTVLATSKMLPTFILGILSIAALIIFTIMNTKKLDKVSVKHRAKRGIANRNIFKQIFLSIITLGIYTIFWEAQIVNDSARIDKKSKDKGWKVILFGILTLGIYWIYWVYTTAKKLSKIKVNGKQVCDDNALLYIFLIIFGLNLVAMCIIQADINKFSTSEDSEDINISSILFIIGAGILSLFILAATIPWETLFKTTVFTDFNTWFYGLKINEYLSTRNLIGSTEVIGTWSFGGLSVLLIVVAVAIKFIYSIDINKFISTVTASVKKILPIAITIILINVVLMVAYSSGIVVTAVDSILGLTGKSFNVITAALASIVSTTFLSDILYSSSIFGSVVSAKGITGDTVELMAMVLRAIHGVVAIMAPASAGLIIGLYYFDIPYTKWVKYIWKLFVVLLLLVIAVTAIFVLI